MADEGFVWAYRKGGGEPNMDERAPGSAFSRGDPLQLTAASTMSAIGGTITSADTVFGIAGADSTDSVNGLCTVLRPTPADVFASEITAGSLATIGNRADLGFNANGRPVILPASVNTVQVVFEREQDEVLGQSIVSRAYASFLASALYQ